MAMKKNIRFVFPPAFFLFVFLSTYLLADTIQMIEDSVLSGKIVQENDREIIFTNSYGTYRIKKSNIKNIFRTNSYSEDFAILKEMKLPANEKQAENNYDAGIKRKVRVARGEKISEKELAGPIKAEFKIAEKQVDVDTTMWTGGRLSVGGGLIYDRPDRGYGYSGYFAFDQGLDRAIGIRHPLMPGIRFEAGYSYLVKPYHTYYGLNQAALISLDPTTTPLIKTKYTHGISGIVTGLGLMWAIPSLKSPGGCMVFAIMPGVSYLHYKTSEYSSALKGYFLNIQSILGYQISFGVFSMFIHARYRYTYGVKSFSHLLGAEAGFGFNAW
jgi:hypothetical protein